MAVPHEAASPRNSHGRGTGHPGGVVDLPRRRFALLPKWRDEGTDLALERKQLQAKRLETGDARYPSITGWRRFQVGLLQDAVRRCGYSYGGKGQAGVECVVKSGLKPAPPPRGPQCSPTIVIGRAPRAA